MQFRIDGSTGRISVSVQFDLRNANESFIIIETDGIAVFRFQNKLLRLSIRRGDKAVDFRFGNHIPKNIHIDFCAVRKRGLCRLRQSFVHDDVHGIDICGQQVERSCIYGRNRGNIRSALLSDSLFSFDQTFNICFGKRTVINSALFNVRGCITCCCISRYLALCAQRKSVGVRTPREKCIRKLYGISCRFTVNIDSSCILHCVCTNCDSSPIRRIDRIKSEIFFQPLLFFIIICTGCHIHIVDLDFHPIFPRSDLESVVIPPYRKHIMIALIFRVIPAESNRHCIGLSDEVGKIHSGIAKLRSI